MITMADEKKPVIKKNKFKQKENKKVLQKTEPKLFARDIATRFDVSPFDFLLIQRENNISETDALTVSEFKEMYRKIIEGR